MAAGASTAGANGGVTARAVILFVAGLLALMGLVGRSDAAVGYALFSIASLLLLAGIGLLAVFALTRWFDTAALRRGFATAFWAGGWTYVLAVSALSGYYVHEALAGRIEWYYMVFGPAILAALVVLDVGVWRIIVQRNLATVTRFGDLWTRESLDQPALRKTLMDEVILHRSLLGVSRFRWLRHQLIFWGFGLMFGVEVMAVFVREVFPSFGWTNIWHQLDHPVRLAFDLAYEVTGVMILVGCILALAFRVMANGTPEQKYTDTPTTVFLLVVVVTGFWVEAARLALVGDYAGGSLSFLGRALIPLAPATEQGHDVLWTVHALAAAGFLAYIPLKRMIHSCATPLGRLVNSQRGLMAAKKMRVLRGLMRSGGRP